MNRVPPFAVLFVCTGNICRSPLAERLLQARLASSAFEIASAGTMAMVGQPMDPEAAAELTSRGGDPTGFKARQMNDYLLGSADLILAATRVHRERILEERPGALKKTFTIREFANLLTQVAEGTPGELVTYASRHRSGVTLTDIDVPDPYRSGPQAHAVAASLISAAVDQIALSFSR